MPSVDWTREIPAKNGRSFLKILSPAAGQKLNFIVLSERAEIVGTHYLWGLSMPHLSPAEDCPGCKVSHDVRRKGYVGCYSYAVKSTCLAELTHDCIKNCSQLTDPQVNLRGHVLILHRPGIKRNGRVYAEVTPEKRAVALPKAPDIHTQMMLVWAKAHDNLRFQPDWDAKEDMKETYELYSLFFETFLASECTTG